MITFDNVTKRYPGGHEALTQVSFSIDTGDLVLVTGNSGAGKSTLLKLISAIERPTSGTVLINQQNISQLRGGHMPFIRRQFGMIFQDHKLLHDRNCFHNVALPLAIHGISGAEAGKRVRAALDKVGLLNKEKAMPITLSGGEQQRLAIARAVVSRPNFLVADEPTANLDNRYAEDILSLFGAFQQVGVTVLIASHDTRGQLLKQSNTRIFQLSHGQLSEPNLSKPSLSKPGPSQLGLGAQK